MIHHGRLVADTTPGQARRALENTIFEGTISAGSYETFLADQSRCVTQAYLVEGHNRIRVYQPEGDPPPGFAAVAPTLEDAYLLLIRGGRLPDHRPASLDREASLSDTSGYQVDGHAAPIGGAS